MAKLSLIDFKIGLPIILTKVNDGKTKFEVDILNNMAKICGFWPKMGPSPLLPRPSNGCNLVILCYFGFLFSSCLFFPDESNGDKN